MRSKLAACFACALTIGLGLSISSPAHALSLSSLLGGTNDVRRSHTVDLVALIIARSQGARLSLRRQPA